LWGLNVDFWGKNEGGEVNLQQSGRIGKAKTSEPFDKLRTRTFENVRKLYENVRKLSENIQKLIRNVQKNLTIFFVLRDAHIVCSQRNFLDAAFAESLATDQRGYVQ
jgi:hypothetical protein